MAARAAWRGRPGLAASVCYSFSPGMVAEHVPAAWAVAAPQHVLATRERAVDRMYKALLGEQIGSPGLAEAAALARDAALAAGTAGRALAAANADLPWPGEPHLVLWHAINLLREHRGDGHITALLSPAWDPCEALVSLPPSAPHHKRCSPAGAGPQPSGPRRGTGSRPTAG